MLSTAGVFILVLSISRIYSVHAASSRAVSLIGYTIGTSWTARLSLVEISKVNNTTPLKCVLHVDKVTGY